MGGFDPVLLGAGEPTVKYHPSETVVLTLSRISGKGTVAGGQFDWGGRLIFDMGRPGGDAGGKSGCMLEHPVDSRIPWLLAKSR